MAFYDRMMKIDRRIIYLCMTLAVAVPLIIPIGMPVQVVPRIWEEGEEIRVYYTVEQPGTTWGKAPAPHLG